MRQASALNVPGPGTMRNARASVSSCPALEHPIAPADPISSTAVAARWKPEDQLDKRWIALILIIYLALGTLYSIKVPLFEAPDEVWHYLYVKHYADGHGLPVYREGTEFPMRQEASQPPLFYMLGGLASSWIDTSDVRQLVQYNPHAAVGTTLPWGNRNMVAHTPRESFPYRGTTLAVHLVRLMSVLMGAGTILCTAAVAAALFPSVPWLPAVAAALVAFNPQFVFIHSSVSNDVLVTLLSSCALYLVVLMWQKGASRLRLAMLGIVLGLAALTKLNGLLLFPLVALTLFTLCRKSSHRQIGLPWMLWTFVPSALVGGWWYARNWIRYRDPLGLKLMFSVMPMRDQVPSWSEALSELSGLFKSFWAVFGWFNIPVEGSVYWLLAIATLLACIGLILMFTRSRTQLASAPPAPGGAAAARRVLGIEMAPLFLLGSWALAYFLGALYWMRTISSQGRLAFPGISALSILLALGLAHVLPLRLRPVGPGLMAVGLLCLAAAVPYRYISPAYANPAPLTTDERNAIVSSTPLSPALGGQAQLLGLEIPDTTVRPGESLWVTLFWQAAASIDRNYSVFVHLVDSRGVILAQHDSWPGAGNDPTSGWTKGDLRRDIHRLDVPTAFLAEGPCRLLVGMYDWSTGRRLPTPGAEDRPLDHVVLPVELVLGSRPGPGLFSLSEVFAQQVALTGYAVEPIVARPGSSLRITLRWQAVRRMDKDYTVFVHLTNERGQAAGQADHVPVDGSRPTSTWDSGEVVTETFELPISAEGAPDRYTLTIGLYELQTMTRLRLSQGGDTVILGQIQVEE